MAPLPPTIPTSAWRHESRDTTFTIHTHIHQLLRVAESILRRDLGPTQKQSVAMAVGLSIAGIVVAIFVFGWVRYIAAREHQREAERRKARDEKAAEEAGGGGEAPAEESPPAE
ncbi:hypothetical protein ABW20_dc0108828 [Dactylellina cionopaga]|nr:hypothetical protein ABW20_dc0108828 [Dactylellina cionopaga]